MKQQTKIKAETRETKKKLTMKVSGKSVFKLAKIITEKIKTSGLTK